MNASSCREDNNNLVQFNFLNNELSSTLHLILFIDTAQYLAFHFFNLLLALLNFFKVLLFVIPFFLWDIGRNVICVRVYELYWVHWFLHLLFHKSLYKSPAQLLRVLGVKDSIVFNSLFNGVDLRPNNLFLCFQHDLLIFIHALICEKWSLILVSLIYKFHLMYAYARSTRSINMCV